MNKLIRIAALFSVLILCLGIQHLYAQNPTFGDLPDVPELTPENIFSKLIDPIYSGLVIVFGYVAYLIPGVNKVKPFIRVLGFGLIAALGFHLFGGSFSKSVISYFFSTVVLYDGFLSNIFKSKNPTTAPSTTATT